MHALAPSAPARHENDTLRRLTSAAIAGAFPALYCGLPPCVPCHDLSPCEAGIVEVLARQRRRVTTSAVVDLLEDAGMAYGWSTVKRALARLVGLGVLHNTRGMDNRGVRGYRIAPGLLP